jgi:hypothetical protein
MIPGARILTPIRILSGASTKTALRMTMEKHHRLLMMKAGPISSFADISPSGRHGI